MQLSQIIFDLPGWDPGRALVAGAGPNHRIGLWRIENCGQSARFHPFKPSIRRKGEPEAPQSKLRFEYVTVPESFTKEEVGRVGFEPTWVLTRRILSPLRLPFRHRPGMSL